MSRAAQGDIDAFEELVRRYQDVAVRVAWAVGARGDAEDAAQDGFVKAHAALARFRPGAPFRPWLLRIVANEARNRRRRAGRQARLALRLAGRPSVDAAPSAEVAAVAGDEHRRLLAAVEALDEPHRLVVTCRYLAGLSEAETAAALGWPPGTVKSRLSRALDRLRLAMGDRAEGERDG